MQGPSRKIVPAVLYELIAIGVLSPSLSWAYDESLASSGGLSVLLSATALLWSMLYNGCFEYWEARQPQRSRTWLRRLLHSLGFEGGLTLILLPVVAAWLNITWWSALATNLALFVFFFFYALLFQWAFDQLFDVPLSAKPQSPTIEQPCP
ncbi:PACE efflux transporter [Pseudomonas syringae group sp. J309-1]|uniref:PACE efflux transporter n=1 Tax=Pseudomonas syringae group sp. J309-1 TaxID=3079588 RepID=UPI00290B009B|nr:PACE efflux transporter [Pseudomonas syringae group sp. J309-1]MDU8362792.1 PACE efflux transporter [Pseudomonas syringae group sp. J309-1]